MPDVICLRPKADFTAIGITPPETLDIAYMAPDDTGLATALKGARALVIPAVGPALAPDLFHGTALKLVQVTGAGLDRVDQATLKAQGIALANVPGGSNAALGEYVVGNAIALSRGFSAATQMILSGSYADHRKAMVSASLRGLGGLTVGLVGMGAIGLAVAQRCHDMGANIAYYDPAPPRDTSALDQIGAQAMELDALLVHADIVTLHVPLIPATRNLIDADRLALMKPDAILINAARGGIVDESALAAALERGHLLGAVVDVYTTEPPNSDNPLLTLSAAAARRIILTPHIAGVSRQSFQHLFVEAWANVTRVLTHGQSPLYTA